MNIFVSWWVQVMWTFWIKTGWPTCHHIVFCSVVVIFFPQLPLNFVFWCTKIGLWFITSTNRRKFIGVIWNKSTKSVWTDANSCEVQTYTQHFDTFSTIFTLCEIKVGYVTHHVLKLLFLCKRRETHNWH